MTDYILIGLILIAVFFVCKKLIKDKKEGKKCSCCSQGAKGSCCACQMGKKADEK